MSREEINFGKVYLYQELLIFIPTNRAYLASQYLDLFFPKSMIVGRCRLDSFRNRSTKYMSYALREIIRCQRMVWYGKYRMDFLDGEYIDKETNRKLP